DEVVLDPFAGSGTTMKKARELGRNSVGFEIKKSLLPVIKKKLGFGDGQDDGQDSLLSDKNDTFELITRKQEKYGPIR
ncbi:site-specific DNA-methyltransferase, partial [candidate division WWE3 bacterium CG09_land_8_20_14_0_10_39_24]